MSDPTKPHIISIDDETPILKLVSAILGEAYTVTTFDDSEQALSNLSELQPDLIICDIDMPGLDGLALHEALRDAAGLRSVPFIFLTGLKDRQTFRQGMVQGADDYLTKPFGPAELREAVETRLSRARVLREETPESHQSPSLNITSLGSANVSVSGAVLHYEAKKVIEVLLFLLKQGEPLSLRTLLSELWRGEVKDNNVHVLLGRARKTYAGLAEFNVDGDQLSLKLLSEYQWDASTFETAAQAALAQPSHPELERASSLYTGSFLPGFDSPWSATQRSHYDSLYLDVLEASLEHAPNEAQAERAQVRLKTFLD